MIWDLFKWLPSCLICFCTAGCRLCLISLRLSISPNTSFQPDKIKYDDLQGLYSAARHWASEPEERLWDKSASTRNNHKWHCPQTQRSSWLVSLGYIMRSATYPWVYRQLNTAQLALQIPSWVFPKVDVC